MRTRAGKSHPVFESRMDNVRSAADAAETTRKEAADKTHRATQLHLAMENCSIVLGGA